MTQSPLIALPNINSNQNTTFSARLEKIPTLVGQKRKREDEGQTLKALKPFIIRACPSSIYDKPYTLKPLLRLERSRLPLSYLDPAPTDSILPTTRLFSAHIDVLDRNDGTKNEETKPPMLLIASLESESSLHAVERVKHGVFALCKLCNWVKVEHLEDTSGVSYTPITRPPLVEKSDVNAENWWTKAVVPQGFDKSGGIKPAKRPRLAMSLPQTTPQPEVLLNTPTLPVPEPAAFPIDTSEPNQGPEISSQQVFETLVHEYLSALYKSKTSLAFFAKGPLSRARAACLTVAQEDLSLSALTAFLRSMLLTMSSMDKKYREKLPGMINEFSHATLSDFEQESPIVAKKRKLKKHPKLSREGTYLMEESHVKRWWFTEDVRRQDETNEQLLRRKIGDLRVRETLAQVILILEILALEALPEFKTAALDSIAIKKETQETQETQNEPILDAKKTFRKFRKPVDLILRLDLLMDKLSIWQSIENDGPAAESQQATDLSSRDNSGKLQDRDLLASFCIEVIIPFYKSRVPEQAALVNKKFGGPGAASPEKYKLPKPRKPIENPKQEKRPRQPLHKTPSESFAHHKASRPPSLARSTTDLGLGASRLKREESGVSLFDIPASRGPSATTSIARLKAQQIDMNAISTATSAKLAQKAHLEEEVKNAINTLKKPNPRQAVKEYVEENEKRSLGSASMRKKTMGVVRKVVGNALGEREISGGVQVAATPRVGGGRRRDALVPATGKRRRFVEEKDPYPPSSGDFCVPSSTVRPTANRPQENQPLFSSRKPLDSEHSVAETPSRGSSKIRTFPAIAANPSSSKLRTSQSAATTVLQDATNNINATPSRPSSAKPLHFASIFTKSALAPVTLAPETAIPQTPTKTKSSQPIIKSSHVFATPQKPVRQLADVVEDVPQTPEVSKVGIATACSNTKEKSHKANLANGEGSSRGDVDGGGDIYDALGWNDDFDDLA
ncbi:hypothetical protein EJ08DRAFT_682709 [Tothia fuscella]|uniref:DNA replication regulator Sld3 C-terminal domain-containing protein n=1 Tax=Tothia fuscella TaxID=1048955 RepID=A0A9P4NHS7_9PEZI|nr:hypothetical protein EJ08DRAFT_682709 [Tothia fuscella]